MSHDNNESQEGYSDFLTPKERSVLEKFNPKELTHSLKQNLIIEEILNSVDLSMPQNFLSDQRKKLGVLAISMIQIMDDKFDNARQEFKQEGRLLENQSLLSKLLSVDSGLHPEGMSIGELLQIINKASLNSDLYPSEKSRNFIKEDLKYLRTTVVDVISQSENDPAHTTYQEALELRKITNGGDAALMFDLSFGDLAEQPGYEAARQKTIDMALAISLADDVGDAIDDLKGEKVNVLLACARDTGEFDKLMAVFRTKGFKRQSARGELGLSVISTLKQLAPEAYQTVYLEQQAILEKIGSQTLSTYQAIY